MRSWTPRYLLVGAVLLVVAGLVIALGRRERPDKPHRERGSLSARAAALFGVFSMATNPTSLALVIPAGKEISSAEGALAGRLVLIVLARIPAWAPVCLVRAAPETGQRALTAVGDWIGRYGRKATIVLLLAAGVFFLARGAIRLV